MAPALTEKSVPKQQAAEKKVVKKVYVFKKGSSMGDKSMKQLLGGKGANLCEMARIGLNVPAGFTISTDVCQEFNKLGGKLPEGLWEDIMAALAEVEGAASGKFADASNPLLVSVRSGAAISMPGMMDTVLNLGLNDKIVKGVAAKYGERFAYDSYRRLLDMFGDVVLGIEHSAFEKEIGALKAKKGVKFDVELTAEDLKELVVAYKGVYTREKQVLPEDPYDQLRMAICAVFRSWMTSRAVKYREINKVTGLKGTAVNVQSMVYGNLSDKSGTGVFFTRSPSDGTNKLYGEFLANAQGEDVVAGIRTPLDIAKMEKVFPAAYKNLVANAKLLEDHMHDMQDCEFTVQEGEFYMLQTRNGKRTGAAALKVAVDLAHEGLVTREEAVLMVEPRHLDQLLHPNFKDPKAYKDSVIAHGLPASPGAAIGRIVFTADDAEAWKEKGEQIILTRLETSPEDVGGMHAAEGILTARGGMTSHAAVVARGWGKPCVCGCDALDVDYSKKVATCGSLVLKEGDWISLNGSTGEVIKGKQELSLPTLSGDLAVFMEWVDSYRRLQVLANADTPVDAAVARKNGAQGIGLTRTEHMFFSTPERISSMRRMIAAEELCDGDEEDVETIKAQALLELKEYQKADFEGIFEAMDGLPVTIRLLDPPLHEFLPHEGTPALDELCEQIAKLIHITPQLVHKRVLRLEESNPMMGMRGCRLGIVHSDITQMQVAAILEAAIVVSKKGIKVHPHIMVPLVGIEEELVQQTDVIKETAEKVFKAAGTTVPYSHGTMIEVPRGALQAGVLAKTAQFFSFGTNDLTQMTFGFSRDDAEAKFLPLYIKQGIIPVDPFETIDEAGVGELIKLAVERGRATNPTLGLGVCGEHGGDPKSVFFFDKVGVDYVSCSPLRVPIARLAAAQAAIQSKPATMADDHCQD